MRVFYVSSVIQILIHDLNEMLTTCLYGQHHQFY
jgi:hypothetical protein